jgi:proteasome lid subunit RPN8/RPN11
MATARQEQFARWSIPGHGQEIEISVTLAAEILAAVKEGFNRFPRGGLEVGGVLFGVHEDGWLQVRAARPIPCKHTLGPSFTLTPEEHDELAARLLALKEDPELAGLVPVGWYHSHTRSGLLLSDADCHLHNRHFPHPWQIALLVKPEAGRPAELGVFVRQPDEELSPRPALVVSEEALLASEAAPGESEPQERPEEATGESVGTGRRLARPAALAVALAVLALAAFRLREEIPGGAVAAYWQRVRDYWIGPAAASAERPFSLSLSNAGAQLIIRWNAAAGLSLGKSASLTVSDGEQRHEIPLDAEAFARGEFRWSRQSERVAVRLAVIGSGDRPLSETAFFVGSLPPLPVQAPPAVLPALEADKGQLEIALRLQKAESDGLAERLAAVEAALKARAPAAPPAPPAKPAVVLAQKAPESAAAELAQRPEAAPPTISGAAAAPSAAPPAAAPSGRLFWTGVLGPGGVLTIQGRQASAGTLSGQLPGVPVRIAVYPAELSSAGLIVYTGNPKHGGAGLTEAPGPANAWTRTTYRYAPEKAALVQVAQAPGEANGWRVIWIRSSAPVTALVIDWELVR